MLASGTVLRNRYKIINKLGSGGFGETYLAEDLGIPIEPKPKCVVKRLKTENLTDEDLDWVKQCFQREAAALYNLGKLHPQIPKLSEYFQAGNEFYLVQDFIDGDDLGKIITPGKKFLETEVIQLLAEILEVLAVVHQQNMIHRDIKPNNIMRRSVDGKIMLIDFGAVKQIVAEKSGKITTTVGVGTPGFRPLEQMRGKPKLASDIYAVGMVGIQALTGILPHKLEHDQDDDEVIWQRYADINPSFAEVLTKMIRFRAAERYQNAAEALQAIQLLNQPAAGRGVATTISLKSFSFEVVTVNARGEITKRRNQQAKYFEENLGNGVTLEMVQIPGGTFIMGSPEGEGYSSEKPQHEVNVPGFFMGKYPVTQAQYQAVMSGNIFQRIFGNNNNNNPSRFKGEKRPVECVSWNDAVEFCQKLGQKTGRTYRLPSEAEWEYACRAGTTTPFYVGETITTGLANYRGTDRTIGDKTYPGNYGQGPKGEFREQTTEVGKFPPNACGLYDMCGNVWEWCQDEWHENYNNAPTDGSAWLGENNNRRLLRGGSWGIHPRNCRSALRSVNGPVNRSSSLGFRVVVSAART